MNLRNTFDVPFVSEFKDYKFKVSWKMFVIKILRESFVILVKSSLILHHNKYFQILVSVAKENLNIFPFLILFFFPFSDLFL